MECHGASIDPSLLVCTKILHQYRNLYRLVSGYDLEKHTLDDKSLSLLIFARYFLAVAELSILDCKLQCALLLPSGLLHPAVVGVVSFILLFPFSGDQLFSFFRDPQLLSLLVVLPDLYP